MVAIGEKIGKPLTEEVGKPRIHPKTLPAPEPETVPAEKPEKEKVPSEARRFVSKEVDRGVAAAARIITRDADALAKSFKGNMVSVSVVAQAYLAFGVGIPRVAKFLGFTDQQVTDGLVTLVARIGDVLKYIRAVKGSTTSKAI